MSGRETIVLTSDYLNEGMAVLESILQNGLLLSYEERILANRDPLHPEGGREIAAEQYRACLTALEGDELKNHSLFFGAFAIGLTHQSARALGAVPVFYLPSNSADGLGSVGTSLIYRLLESCNVLDRLDQLKRSRTLSSRERQLIHELTGDISSLPDTAGALRFLFNIIYLTEDDTETSVSLLRYYSQREWRLIAGISLEKEVGSRRLDEEEIRTLFGNRKPARGAYLLDGLTDRPLRTMIQSVVCPDQCVEAVGQLIARWNERIFVRGVVYDE